MAIQDISLHELNSLIREILNDGFPERYWVSAEISEARENYSGHCYLEFTEKDNLSGQIIAKARGVIWASTFLILKPYFEEQTGEQFRAGIKVLVQVSIDFHELYGLTLTVHDIDPTYTLGDIARHRAEILRQLTEEGVIDMNKELAWNYPPQRIAVISSKTAAGYGDFTNQLKNNPNGYAFYTVLFQATMQGSQTEASIISALEKIYEQADNFDGVVIIRGGGATSELNCFDSYLLAQHITQFPLPVLTGIGHDRDETVIDKVANIRVKTPTAAAEWLISQSKKADEQRISLRNSINLLLRQRLQEEVQQLTSFGREIPRLLEQRIQKEKKLIQKIQQSTVQESRQQLYNEKIRINNFTALLPRAAEKALPQEQSKLAQFESLLRQAIYYRIKTEKQHLDIIGKTITLTSPEQILKKGYSLTLKGGKVVHSIQELQSGDKIITLLKDGEKESKVI
ncbi:exodeoxyribonuclease VII large subunit [Coprobacter sp.]